MKTVVHVPTKELWNKVVQKELDKGKRWFVGEKTLLTSLWNKYESESCISVGKWLGYSPLEWFKEKGYQIISAEEYLKVELKVGDRVRFKQNRFPKNPETGIITKIEGAKIWWKGNPINGDNEAKAK
jgi:hypothetical protein